MNDLVVVRAALLPSRRHLLLKYLSFCRCCCTLSLLLSLIQEYLLEVCFGVKLDKLLLDSHERVKKDQEKNFKKKTKIFSLSSVLVVLKYLVTFISSLLLFREEEVKEEDEEHRRTTKNHLISSSRTTLKYTQQK